MMSQNFDDSKFIQTYVAEALYDNIAESPDELPFRKNDLLIVLQQNITNLPGWWLCSFKGRQGICPGNRLRLVRNIHDCSQKSKNFCEPNGFQPDNKRLSWHVHSNRLSSFESVQNISQSVLKSNFNGDDGSNCRYDVPPFGQPIPVPFSGNSKDENVYQDGYRKARSSTITARELQTRTTEYDSQKYDVPRSTTSILPLSPTSSISSFAASISDSMSGSNRSSMIPDYDVPSPLPLSTLHSRIITSQENDRISSTLTSYDIPLQISRELPLELSSAVENLEQLQIEVTDAINMLLSFASPLWRETDKLEPKLMDIKLAVLRLRSALHDLSEFGEGVLGNALNAPARDLVQKLRPLTKTLFETNKIVQESAKILEDCNWSIQVLGKNPDKEINSNFDSLDQLITCARSLTEDVRRFASFVQGNATLLFKRNLRDNEDEKNTSKSSGEGDYVNFESHKTLKEANNEVRSLLSHNMRRSFDLLIKEAERGNALAQLKKPMEIDQNDKQVLSFYAAQCATHLTHLTHAIDAFLHSVEHNQPPKIFLAHGKFVVLSAHRLVHIGDTVRQNLACVEINARVARLSDALSEALASTVHKIKRAAVKFPSVVAVQEMVNSVVDVSHLAKDLKTCLIIASQT